MHDVVVFAQVAVPTLDAQSLRQYQSKNLKALEAIEGFKSLSIWQGEADPESYLVVFVFRDGKSAELGYEASVEAGPLVQRAKHMVEPPEVRRGKVAHALGKAIGEMPVGSYTSLSVRVAEPGTGEQLLSGTTTTFRDLASLPGFEGFMCTVNETLAEEVVGVVLWSSRDAFLTSLPPRPVIKINLYRRIL